MRKFFRSNFHKSYLRQNKKFLRILELDDKQKYSKDELKKQYFKLAKKYHPDKVQNQSQFVLIKDCYEKLINEVDNKQSYNQSNSNQYEGNFDQQFKRFQQKNKFRQQSSSNNSHQQYYQQQNQYQDYFDILDNKYFQALEIGVVILLLIAMLYHIEYSRTNRVGIKLSSRQIRNMIEERNQKVKGLQEFTERELDIYDTKELILLEREGYKKIPDYMYKNILMIYLQENSKKSNQQLIMSDNSLNQEQGKNQSKQESKKKRRPRSAVGERNYLCGCGKAYLSYPALYTHVKNKHGGVFPIGSNAKRKIQKNDEENLEELFTQDLESFYEEFQDFVQEANANNTSKETKIKPSLVDQLFEKIQQKNHKWEKVFKEQILNQGEQKGKKDELTIYQVFSNFLISIYQYCSEKFFSEYFYLIFMFSECINKHGHHFIDLDEEKENNEEKFCMGTQILVISRMTNLFIAEHFLERFKEMQKIIEFEYLGEEEDQIKNLILMSKLMSNWFFHKKLSPYRMEINVDF